MAIQRMASKPRRSGAGLRPPALLPVIWACVALAACQAVPPGPKPAATGPVPDVPVTQGRYVVGTPYQRFGNWYRPAEDWTYNEVGAASWYGRAYHGRRTANGETFDLRALTAAHPTLPLPCRVRVTNVENGKSIEVRVNDRGPFEKGRMIDLSERAAELLGFREKGTAMVRVEMLGRAPLEVFRMARPKDPAPDLPVRAAPTAEVRAAVLPPPSAAPAENRGGEAVPAPASPPAAPAATGADGLSALQPPADPLGELIDSISDAPVVAGEEGAVPAPDVTGTGNALPPEPSVSSVSSVARQFFVQAGAFTVPENAYSLRRLILKAIEGAAVSINPAQIGEREFFRVRVGPFASNEEAKVMLARLHNLGQNEAEIISD